MDTRRRLARTGAPHVGRAFDALANGMVEYHDAIRLQRRPDKGFGGGVIDASYLLIVVEIPDDGRVPDQGKALAVERKAVRDQARVEDRNVMGFRQCRGLGLARRDRRRRFAVPGVGAR
jgi:hypothetical protein